MRRTAWTLFLSLVLAVAVLSGCSSATVPKQAPPVEADSHPTAAAKAEPKPDPKADPKPTQYPVTVKDAAGRSVTLASEPKRVISVIPSNTELTFALGKGSVLVGRSDYDDYPAEAKAIPSIGGILKPDYEKFVALKPDLILFSPGSEKIRDTLVNDYKLNAFVINPTNFATLYDQIVSLGVVLNAQAKASALVDDMQKSVRTVTDKTLKATTSPKVFYHVWDEPLMTAGANTFVDDLIRLAGGTNVGADVKGFAEYSPEKLAAGDPEYILADSADVVAKVKAHKGWEAIKAIKEGKVLAVPDSSLVTRPGPRLVEGLKWMAQTLHPELFK